MLYRPFLREAWRLTWERKNLWIFGIFAALISTGGVVDVVWRSLEKVKRTESLLKNLMDASFIGYEIAQSYIGQLAVLGSERISFIVVVFTLMGILLVIIATLSQGALVLGIRANEQKNPYALRREAGLHFWSLFLIGAFNKILMLLLVVLMTLPLLFISVSTNTGHGVLFLILMLLFIPTTIILNIVYMFAILDVIETGSHPISAIYTGARLFERHWLATLEYGLILFFVVFGAGLLFFVFASLLVIPFSMLYTTILFTGSLTLSLLFPIAIGLCLFAVLLVFIGACVTFQYSAWYHFYKHGLHKTHGKKVFSKILRLAYR